MTAEGTPRRHRSPRGPACSTGRSARRVFSTLPPAHVDRQVHGGDGPPRMAQRLSPGLPAGRSHHRRGHHPQPAATPRRLGADVARASAGQPDPQLGRSHPHLRGELLGNVCAPWELLGPARMHPEVRRVAPGLHTALLQALHGAPERGPNRDRTCLP
jgi:hypothetical protein